MQLTLKTIPILGMTTIMMMILTVANIVDDANVSFGYKHKYNTIFFVFQERLVNIANACFHGVLK